MIVFIFFVFVSVAIALPCSTTNCSFTRFEGTQQLTFNSSRALCQSKSMFLVTPIDQSAADELFSKCNSTFLAFRLNGSLLSENSCWWKDVDDPTFELSGMSPLWYKSTSSGAFEPNNGASATSAECNKIFQPGEVYREPCSQLYCNANSGTCVSKALDRKCDADVPGFATSCVACGRASATPPPSTLPPTSPTTSSQSQTISTTPPEPSTSAATGGSSAVLATSPSPVAGIVGGVVGGLAALLLLGVLAFVLVRKRRRQSEAPAAATTTTSHSNYDSSLNALK